MNFKIALVKGDGIGPEVVEQAVRVFDTIGEKFSHSFSYVDILLGGAAIDQMGVPLPEGAIDQCKRCDSVLLGAVGGPKWEALPLAVRPERALLGLRKGLNLYANIRPAYLYPALADACPLKPEIIKDGFDLVVIRELTGGLYFGERGRTKTPSGESAFDNLVYSEEEIERVGRVAFELARKRRKKLCSIDKANVLETSRLWREVMHSLQAEYPEIEYSDMLVDNAAMQLIRNPAQFDVCVTENMFGDILTDEASMVTGSIGMLPSASLGGSTLGLYEPIHGSAPDIAGEGIANPVATILSVALMMRYSFNLPAEAVAIENAVEKALNDGLRTGDIAKPDEKTLSTEQMGSAICENIASL